MSKRCAFCNSKAMEFVHTERSLVVSTTEEKVRAEVCAFCDDNIPSLGSISPAAREMWRAAAAVANYLEIRLKG